MLAAGWAVAFALYYFNGGPEGESLQAFWEASYAGTKNVLLAALALSAYGLALFSRGLLR